MGIDAKCCRKEERTVLRIAVEEIAVVEIAVAAGERHRLGGLMDGIVVAVGEHRGASLRAKRCAVTHAAMTMSDKSPDMSDSNGLPRRPWAPSICDKARA